MMPATELPRCAKCAKPCYDEYDLKTFVNVGQKWYCGGCKNQADHEASKLHRIEHRYGLGDTVCMKLQIAGSRPHIRGDGTYEPGNPVTFGMVTAIHVRPGMTSYSVTWADSRQETVHFEMELASQSDSPE
jgi:hypothetical protein